MEIHYETVSMLEKLRKEGILSDVDCGHLMMAFVNDMTVLVNEAIRQSKAGPS